MLGFGKQKIYLGQYCRAFGQTLINLNKDYDYEAITKAVDSSNVIDDYYHGLLATALNFFRHDLFGLFLTQKALTNKLKRDPYAVGEIHAQATKLAFEDKGYLKEDIDFFSMIIMKDIEFIVDEHVMKSAGTDLFNLYICKNYSKKFSDEIFKNISEEERREIESIIFVIAMAICSEVEEIFEESFNKLKFIG